MACPCNACSAEAERAMNMKASVYRFWCVFVSALMVFAFVHAAIAADAPTSQPAATSILPNADLEADADKDAWPDGWPRGKEGCTWEKEGNAHFLRLKSSEPGKMVMYYREVPLPKDAGAL